MGCYLRPGPEAAPTPSTAAADRARNAEAHRSAVRVAHPWRPPLAEPARLRLGGHPALVLGDPRLGVGFALERADLGRIGIRDRDFDAERPVLKRDHPVGRFGM